MNIFLNIWNVLSKPIRFWESIEHDQSFAKTVFYAIAICFIGTIVSSIVLLLQPDLLSSPIPSLASRLNLPVPTIIIGGVACAYFLYFVGFFINSVILFVVTKALRGTGTLVQTYQAVVYAATPLMLLGLMPAISVLTGFWMEILKMFGMKRYHRMSYTKTITILFIVDMLLIFLVISIAAVVFYSFRDAISIHAPMKPGQYTSQEYEYIYNTSKDPAIVIKLLNRTDWTDQGLMDVLCRLAKREDIIAVTGGEYSDCDSIQAYKWQEWANRYWPDRVRLIEINAVNIENMHLY
jgi:hypothetical protein